MRKIHTSFVILLLSLFALHVNAANYIGAVTKNKKPPFRVVGYVMSHGNLDTASSKVNFKQITHLNVAFLNPDSLGNLTAPIGLNSLIEKAHAENVKVLFSFGGGNPPVFLKKLLQSNNRELWVTNMLAFADEYRFDGIDVDLEGDFIDSNYDALINSLSSALKPNKKLLTAAVATWNGHTISDEALSLFDFINVMAYDHTGPWNKSNPGQHSSYKDAVADFDYWNTERGISADRLILGLPYYGYGFGASIPASLTYSDILARYPDAAKTDSVTIADQGTIYYNGVSTITKKVKFVVKKHGGGVMIWQLLGDAQGDNSLLTIINNIKK
ncbi:chitinase [Pedobacter sp. UYP30]|uniref:glycosyl hydrolase family 18 protein n=1 Tax=Pedobacter sp. UYP30 TaxID=1756400 RepID=UPI003395E263